ncbi:Uncharacterised protein [Edwardsiella tarda]|nr:Uncharacterised protein [Edwardsiella tarda]
MREQDNEQQQRRRLLLGIGSLSAGLALLPLAGAGHGVKPGGGGAARAPDSALGDADRFA